MSLFSFLSGGNSGGLYDMPDPLNTDLNAEALSEYLMREGRRYPENLDKEEGL